MYRALLLGIALTAPGLALACDGAKQTASADADTAHAAVAAKADPTHCAKKSELVGANCSYTTGMMAQRVLEQGENYSYTGTLERGENQLPSRVAAPYTVGPDAGINIVANEVVDKLVSAGAEAARVTIDGRLLEVDGVRYFVATQFAIANT